ncbi:tectonic-like complex member MKS1 [Ruditapes philippinarum]|uniref:tectonic-like complex member MKS1 n=1 Tax=Ruditapes philippinarum TaxID=129788 RepID=UPI00295AF280|nr:tectonic-like complex member MKS1 [Ruditapes philippinarum]
MADLYEPDVGTAYYRSADPVKNLRLSVKLDRITSSSLIPKVPGAPAERRPSSEDVELKDLTKQGMKDKEEIVISWQQKIFSQREIELYNSDDPNFSPIEKKYHNEVKALLDKGKPANRIFTYVDHDRFSQEDEATEYLTTSPKEQPTFLSEKMSHIRRRRVGMAKQRKERDHTFVPKLNVIEDDPTEELITRNHLMASPVQIMHIMADLSPRDRLATDEEEVVLCTIQIDANGVLSIHPDFNRGRRAYVKETQKEFGKDVFEYTIEHASKEMNRQEQDREMKMYREVYTRHKDFLQACVGTEFELPPADVLRLLVYGEIESAKDFEYDDLYLHFFVDLPKYWSVERHQQLSWVTQTCATKVHGRDDVAYFSFPFHFELFYRNDNLVEEEKELELPHFPTIMIEVLSLDTWNRFRTEGYTYLTIPGQPGKHKERLHCWRPTGTSMTSQLRRFFIGGSPELEDPTYSAIPSTFTGTHLSKFGFKTETTGSVDVNLNVMMQSRAFREKKASKQSLSSLLEALGINAVQQNITNVLDAFKKARQRMLNARESATKDLIKTSSRTATA